MLYFCWRSVIILEKKYFTDEQVELLHQNPYVKKVSHKAITYTDEFKTVFMQKYAEGSTPSVILTELGFDPRMLGRRRINGLVERMHRHVRRDGDCHDLRKECSGRPSSVR